MVENKRVAWNASQGLIMEISNRRSLANTYFIQGNIHKALSTLISIKQSVIQSFKEEEREKLKIYEDKFSKISYALHSSVSNSFNSEMNNAYKLARDIAVRLYSDYNDILMDLLDSRGYLIGEQSDSSSMNF